jgi:hypothetical protein
MQRGGHVLVDGEVVVDEEAGPWTADADVLEERYLALVGEW